jgi:DNA transformation protein and related proteins
MDDDALRDVFSVFGPISIRNMFGGKGIYADGLIIAAVMDDGLRLKADAQSAPLFEAAGGAPWIYAMPTKSGTVKKGIMPYWTVPASALDDPEEMAHWARLALQAARRSDTAKNAKAKRKSAR